METETTVKLEYMEPLGLEDAQIDVDINDCKFSLIILANFVNGINSQNLLNRGKL